jgi:hypothetical protein
MKHVSWIVLLLSLLCFLVAVYNKFAGQDGWILGYVAQSWWRVAMYLAVFAIASRIACPWIESGK